MEELEPIAPYTLCRPARQTAPLVLTSPHSGRRYPAALMRTSRLDAVAIRRSEDCYVEELFAAAPGLGVPLLAANFPRAWCDVNREAWELDPAMFADALPAYVNVDSPRAGAGLGTIPRIVGAGEPIYQGKLRFAEAEARIAACWEPFHEALRRLIDETLARFGACLVIDCHSMPSAAGRPAAGRADIVLGDNHGASCAAAVSAAIQGELGHLGFTIRRNDPYAGGYITRHYGQPLAGVQTLQVELARSLYMDEGNLTRLSEFRALQARVARFLAALLPQIAALLGGADLATAAE